jgi:hypothetical protein
VKAEDDPEARIRELERPLSDFAGAAELTVPSAGVDWQSSAPPGNRRGIAVAARAIAAVLVMIAAVVVFLISRGATSTSPGFPTMPGSAVPKPSASPSSSKIAPTPPVAASPAVPVPESPVSLTIVGAEENKTLACAGRYVSVSGVRNTVALTGRCAGLTVSGIGNVITVDAPPTIAASGINDRVTYRSGDPEVSTSGIDNVVERG